jgi:hypothetical protein
MSDAARRNAPTAEEMRGEIARLEGRISALEEALDRRSRELRLLQGALCPRDLVQLARIADGLPPLPRIAHRPEYWTETTVIAPADLESTLEDLWVSLTPSPAAQRPAPQAAGSPWSAREEEAASEGHGKTSE